MTRRRLGLDEIAHYRESYGDQLRTALLAGKPTAALRKAIADLDEHEAEAHAAVTADLEQAERAVVERGRAIAAESRRELGAMLEKLAPPATPA